jgi:integrase
VPIFPSENGGYVSPWTLLRKFCAAMKAAGIARVDAKGRTRNFHSTRHTHAAPCLEAGAPLQWVSEQLGQADATITARTYAHVGTREGHAIAERLEGLLV